MKARIAELRGIPPVAVDLLTAYPERDGNQAVYGFRHFVQALLVRKLLG